MGPPVSAAFDAEGHPTNAGARLRAQARRGLRRARAGRHAEGQIPVVSSGTFAAARRSTCCRTCSARCCATCTFPKQMHWDAQLEDGKGELLVRPADPLAAVPLRRARRAVHDRAAGAGVEPARAGRHVRRRDLRPPVPGDERPRRPRDQGAQLRRVPQEARPRTSCILSRIDRRDRIMRDLEAQARRIGGRAMLHQHAAGRGAARGSAGSRRVPGGRGRRVQRRVPDAAGRSADDDADSSSAFLPGRRRRPAR